MHCCTPSLNLDLDLDLGMVNLRSTKFGHARRLANMGHHADVMFRGTGRPESYA